MRAALLSAALLLLLAAPAAAAPGLVNVGDFNQPVYVASPPRDTRVFVVEKPGMVTLIGGGTFLDVSSITDASGERGLLSIAFSPNYAANGLFYVFLTGTGGGALRVLEFQRSADPDRADPAVRRELVSIPHPDPAPYHNGGQLQVGPDGMLYVSTGEGHQSANAQDTGSLLGKILRLDPATGGAAAGNPFGRVWAYGLRNPWRFSFDRGTGDLAIGDVGASTWEEINWAPAPGRGRGVNFGWPVSEGLGSVGQNPIIAHDHVSDAFCAIVGGYVVRDPGLPTLRGRYLYGDNCRTGVWSAAPRTGAGDRQEPAALAVPALTSFGEDACGRIYAASLNGPVYRLQDGAATPCAFGGRPADTTAPAVEVALRGLRRTLSRRRIAVAVRCSEPCQTAIGTRLRKVRRLKTRHRALAADRLSIVRMKLSRATVKRVRNRLRRHRFVRVSVAVRAVDAAENARTAHTGARIVRKPR